MMQPIVLQYRRATHDARTGLARTLAEEQGRIWDAHSDVGSMLETRCWMRLEDVLEGYDRRIGSAASQEGIQASLNALAAAGLVEERLQPGVDQEEALFQQIQTQQRRITTLERTLEEAEAFFVSRMQRGEAALVLASDDALLNALTTRLTARLMEAPSDKEISLQKELARTDRLLRRALEREAKVAAERTAFLEKVVEKARERAAGECATICRAMVVGGRAWTHDQDVSAQALLAAAQAIERTFSISSSESSAT